jgi:hypothetical protein
MGRELKRVPLDFDCPIDTTWSGYLNPHYVAKDCEACCGSGSSPTAKKLHDQWYGNVLFKPEDRGSVPLQPTDEPVWAFAKRNVEHAPDFYGTGEAAILREAKRLCRLWNGQWCHHLNDDDVGALVEADRLYDLTKTWTPGEGWKPKVPAHRPTAQEVNTWSLSGMSHDSINCWVVVRAECARLGVAHDCHECNGDGAHWPSPEAHQLFEDWKQIEPPEGDGYQIWQTVSEGGPISPVFSTPEDLARHMATTRWGADKGTSYETWLAFIRGPGWAPSLISSDRGVQDGVSGVVDLQKSA